MFVPIVTVLFGILRWLPVIITFTYLLGAGKVVVVGMWSVGFVAWRCGGETHVNVVLLCCFSFL